MYHPKELLAASVKETSVVIEGKNEVTLYLLGSTFTTSVPSGHETSLGAIMAETGPKGGIIAVKVCSRERSFDYFLEIKHEGMNPKIDLSCAWFPEHTLAQINGMDIYVTRDGVRYSTSEKDRDKPGYRYVPDRDLLCRFIYNQISEEDLKKAAEEAAEELSAREKLNEAKKKIEELKHVQGKFIMVVINILRIIKGPGGKKDKLISINSNAEWAEKEFPELFEAEGQ